MDNYKAAAYNVRRPVKEAKKEHGEESGTTVPGRQPHKHVARSKNYDRLQAHPPPYQVLMHLLQVS